MVYTSILSHSNSNSNLQMADGRPISCRLARTRETARDNRAEAIEPTTKCSMLADCRTDRWDWSSLLAV